MSPSPVTECPKHVFRCPISSPNLYLVIVFKVSVTALHEPWKISVPVAVFNASRGAIQAAVAGGRQREWSVHASPDGSLQDLSTGRPYPYLFWEADSVDGGVSRSFGLDETGSFCVAGRTAGTAVRS